MAGGVSVEASALPPGAGLEFPPSVRLVQEVTLVMRGFCVTDEWARRNLGCGDPAPLDDIPDVPTAVKPLAYPP